MTISVYVDGSGGPKGRHGFFVKDTGESHYAESPGATNNQAEYLAVIAALRKFASSGEQITIFSDSQSLVNQINHKYGINSDPLRDLAREVWTLVGGSKNISFVWIPREKNLAGKMLGS